MQAALLHVLTVWTIWHILAWSDLPGYKQVRNKLLTRFDTLREMVHCPLCFGFWISLALCVFTGEPSVQLTFIGAGGTFILDKVIALLESKS